MIAHIMGTFQTCLLLHHHSNEGPWSMKINCYCGFNIVSPSCWHKTRTHAHTATAVCGGCGAVEVFSIMKVNNERHLSVGLDDVTLDLIHCVRSVWHSAEMEALEDHLVLGQSAWKNITQRLRSGKKSIVIKKAFGWPGWFQHREEQRRNKIGEVK